MLAKTLGAMIAVLTSLGLAAWVDDPQTESSHATSSATATARTTSPVGKFEVQTINVRGNEESVDTAETLSKTYDLLVRLKGERLDDRPRELLDRAAVLYREAVNAYGDGSEANVRKADPTALAAHELAQAVDRLNQALRIGRVDTDLPKPPASKAKKLVVRSIDHGKGQIEVRVEALPPPIEGKLLTEDVIGSTDSDHVIVRQGRLLVDGTGRHRVVVEGEKPGEKIESNRVFVFTPDAKMGGLPQVAAQVAAGVAKDLKSKLVTVRPWVQDSSNKAATETLRDAPAADASQELQRAHDKIQAMRDRFKDAPGAMKMYLEPARELYNSALRDAEAGRIDRATDLAHAAMVLAGVPELLASKSDPNEPFSGGKPRAHADPFTNEKTDQDKDTVTEKKVERRIEIRVEHEDDARPGDGKNDPGDEKSIEGIGAVLSFEDGEVRVVKLVPGSPAAKDGRLKPGDRIVGVVTGDDKTERFEGIDGAGVVEKLRGPSGSSVKIVVIKKGSGATETYEIQRRKVDVPIRTLPDPLP